MKKTLVTINGGEWDTGDFGMTSITQTMSDPRAGPPTPTQGLQPAAATTMPRPATPGAFEKAADTAPATQAAQGASKQVTVSVPEISAGKLQLSLDDETGRVIGKIVDRNTGELLWQVPSDEMLRLIAATDKMLGPIYSTEA